MQFVALSLHQHSVQLRARGGGAALPVLLAAHLHPSAAWLHAGYSLLSHSLPGGAAVQLFTQIEGAACGGGQYCYYFFFVFHLNHLFFIALLNPALANMDVVVLADVFQDGVQSVFICFVFIGLKQPGNF